jgi:hypothetical protein
MICKRIGSFFMALFVAAVMSTAADAAVVTVFGDDLSFTYDDSTLYGSATVVGNNIFFLPTSFTAESLNGGSDLSNEILTIQIDVTTEGFVLTDFSLTELGDYFLEGSGATVSVGGNFTVASGTSAYSDTDSLSAGPLLVQGAYTDWSVSSTIMLVDTAGWASDASVLVTLENILSAETLANGEQAFIEKKIGAVGIMTNEAPPIPVPAAVWLFGSALFGLAGLRRRSQ